MTDGVHTRYISYACETYYYWEGAGSTTRAQRLSPHSPRAHEAPHPGARPPLVVVVAVVVLKVLRVPVQERAPVLLATQEDPEPHQA